MSAFQERAFPETKPCWSFALELGVFLCIDLIMASAGWIGLGLDCGAPGQLEARHWHPAHYPGYGRRPAFPSARDATISPPRPARAAR
jgi:hypothetical protein